MIRRFAAFLRAETGFARADYAAALALVLIGQQIGAHEGRTIGAAIRPAFAVLA